METRKFYERCGRMLKDVKEKRMGIKTACYKTEMPKKYMAILSSILRRYPVLDRVVNLLGMDVKSHYFSIVLCYEILYGNKRESIGFNKKMIAKVKEIYKSLGFKDTATERKQETAYLRVNTLKADATSVSSLSLEETIIPHVYKVLEKVNWPKLKTYVNGMFFVQDLGSCMPAYVLNPPKGSVAIDTCSAPGNKTTHLSMVMNNTGSIYAVEKDSERFKVLREMVEKSGAENIITINMDFLSITKSNGAELFQATHFLVDPSCTGSGMHPDEEKDQERLINLTAFQLKILNRALSFPKAEKVVYSTCSIYEEENESVVYQALKANPQFTVKKVLPAWSKRGVPGYDFSDDVIRCGEDTNTKGFFLACLVKK
ncbi:25S rRNA (cytosine2278-C5)-methyltransferase [Nematocida sp. AWRm80]|nr:25S rRNA (cytosine2278-C5)-methyltransferase [Nematocida sp. AWRm80]